MKPNKNKKLILAHSAAYLLYHGILFSGLIVCIVDICICVHDDMTIEDIIATIVGAVGIIAILIYGIRFALKARIEIYDDKIFVPKGTGTKGWDLIQHKTEIKFSKIVDISFCYLDQDSKGGFVLSVFRPLFYLLFIEENGKERGISMHYYTRKQTIQLVDEVLARCKAMGKELPIASGKEFIEDCWKKIKEAPVFEKRKKRK